MAKITELDSLDPAEVDGSEAVPVVKETEPGVFETLRSTISELLPVFPSVAGKFIRLVNRLDRSIMARIDMETGAWEFISGSFRDSLLSRAFGFASGDSLSNRDAPGQRTLTDEGEIIEALTGTGQRRIADLYAARLVASAAYVERLFYGPADRIPVDLADVNLVLLPGQSWDFGYESLPVINSQSRFAQVITFNGGVRQQDTVAENASALQSFVTGVELAETGTDLHPTAALGETGAIACGNRLVELLRDHNNIPPNADGPKFLFAAVGEGSQSIETLFDPAGPYMASAEDAIAQLASVCAVEGKSWRVLAITIRQNVGASDEPGLPGDAIAEYPAELEAGRQLIEGFALAHDADHRPVPLITWQAPVLDSTPANATSAQSRYASQVAGLDAFDNLYCCGPSYQFQSLGAANVHIPGTEAAQSGRDFAQAIKRVAIDGEDYQPLRPASLRSQGRVALLDTTLERGSLVLDTTKVAEAANYGFNAYDAGGAPLAIESVTIIPGTGKIRIVAEDPLPVGWQLGYADAGTDLTYPNKWRGNVRSDESQFRSRDDRWLVAFRTAPF